MEFSESIKSERERLGLTQAEAAALCQVSPRVWWQWEKGQEPLHPTKLGVLQILMSSKAKEKSTTLTNKTL